MGNLALFSTAFLVAFSGAMMPGPLLSVTIAHSLQSGFVAGPLISFGHGLMEILVIIALLVGLGQVLEQEAVAAVVALGGGLVLAWMGLGMVALVGHNRSQLCRPRPAGRGHGSGLLFYGTHSGRFCLVLPSCLPGGIREASPD